MVSYQDPHVLNKPSLNLSLSGGYNNSAVISTYKAAILSGALRLSQRVTKPTTLIYSFSYRRVVVNSNTLQVSLSEIPLLAQPVRVGGRESRSFAIPAMSRSMPTMAPSTPGKCFRRTAYSARKPTLPAST